MNRRVFTLVVLNLFGFTLTVFAQHANVLNTYPLSASQAVVSEPAIAGQPPLAYVGSGSGVAIVDVSSPTNPTPWSSMSTAWFPTLGFVRDLALVRSMSRDRLYVAAHNGGLWSYNISTSGGYPSSGVQLPQSTIGTPWCVAALDVTSTTTERVVFVGTNDNDTGGSLNIVVDAVSSGLTLVGSYNVGSPVYSIAVTTSIVSNTTTVFVGTACSGIYRFDIPSSSLFTSPTFGTPSNWTLTGGAFIRDLIYYETVISGFGTSRVLLAAAHGNGVFRFDVSGSGSLTATGSPWPILEGSGGNAVRFDSIALSPGGRQLVAVGGGDFVEERQHFGSCSIPVVCDGTSTSRPNGTSCGVFVYDLRDTFGGQTGFARDWADDATQAQVLGGGALHGYSVATRTENSTQYFIDVSADARGYQLYRHTTGTPSTVSSLGDFAKSDKLLLGSVDDVWFHDYGSTDVLFSASETAVWAHDVTNIASSSVGSPIAAPASSAAGAAVLVEGFDPPTSPSVVVGGTSDSFSVYKVGFSPLTLTNLGNVPNGGRQNFFLTTHTPVVPSSAPSQNWVIVVNNPDDDSTIDGPGFKIWDIAPVIGTSPNNIHNIVMRAHYLDGDEDPSPSPTPPFKSYRRQYGDVVAVDGPSTNHVTLYVAYGPSPGLYSSGTPSAVLAVPTDDCGVAVFDVDATSTSGNVTVTLVDYVPAITSVAGNDPITTLHLNDAKDTLYAGFGCYGVAQYDVTSTLAPSVQGTRSVSGKVALGAIEHQGDVYITYLSGGIEWEPAGTFGTPAPTLIATTMQANQLVPDPTNATSPQFYLADGRGGVHRISP